MLVGGMSLVIAIFVCVCLSHMSLVVSCPLSVTVGHSVMLKYSRAFARCYLSRSMQFRQASATTELVQLRAARKQEVERFGSAQNSLAEADEALRIERVGDILPSSALPVIRFMHDLCLA